MVVLFFLFPLLLWGDAKVEVLLDDSSFAPEAFIAGTVQVTHDTNESVDPNSFVYQGKPLAVDYLRKVHFSGPESLDMESYRFKLPPQSIGEYRLEPISVRVAGKEYRSIPVDYEVKKMKAPQPALAAIKPYLKLEPIFIGNEPLYPGMTATVGYRYLFQGAIELQKEVIPLLDQTLFTKLGEKQINDTTEGSLSVREITQKIRVEKSGEYTIDEAILSGYAYVDKEMRGPRVYLEPKLISTVPPSKIIVAPFPEKGKPPFFYGAIGPFEIKTVAKAPPRLNLGDTFNLYVTFQGAGVVSTLKPPDLTCQPGWSGFFQAGDLPPEGEKKGGEITFVYEIRPLTSLASRIPPIFLAYFDPTSIEYKIISSAPIPLSIEGKIETEKKEAPKAAPTVMKGTFKIPESPPLSSFVAANETSRLFTTPAILLLIPASLLFVWFAYLYREKQEARKRLALTLTERLARAQMASDLKTFTLEAEAALRLAYKTDPLPEAIQNYIDKLEAALWGKEKPEKTVTYYEELRGLCMPNGKRALIKS